MRSFQQLTLLLYLGFYVPNSHQLPEATNLTATQENYALLNKRVAEHWGFNHQEPLSSLQQLAEKLLENYDLNLDQKVNSILARHVLKSFERSLSQEEYINHIRKMDALAYSKQDLDFVTKENYLFLQALVDSMVLNEDEVEMSLLIESFAPEDEPLARNVGTFKIINKLLDGKYKDDEEEQEVLKLSSRELQEHFQQRVLANFYVPKSTSATTSTTTAS